jgi:hypothetical protein
MIGGLLGIFVVVRHIPLTALRNQVGGAKESSGPWRGSGKNDLASDDRNDDSRPSVNEHNLTGMDSPMTAASLASAALSL